MAWVSIMASPVDGIKSYSMSPKHGVNEHSEARHSEHSRHGIVLGENNTKRLGVTPARATA